MRRRQRFCGGEPGAHVTGEQPLLTGAGFHPATRSAVVAPYRCSIPASENIPAQRSRPIATANVASCVMSVANSAGVSA